MFKRLARIYPVFLVGMLLFTLVSILINRLPPFYIPLLSAAFVQTYFPALSMSWYDSGAWSVANEMFFYLLFPLALPLAMRLRSRTALLIGLVLSGFLGTALNLWAWRGTPFVQDAYALCFSFPPVRFTEFVAGIIAALLVIKFAWRTNPWAALLLCIFAIAFLIIVPPLGITVGRANWIVLLAIAGLISAMTAYPNHKLFKWMGSDSMRYLGRISYAFYIAQLPLLCILDWLVASHRVSSTNIWVLPVGLILNLLAGASLHRFVEIPAHRWLIAWRKNRPAAVTITA